MGVHGLFANGFTGKMPVPHYFGIGCKSWGSGCRYADATVRERRNKADDPPPD